MKNLFLVFCLVFSIGAFAQSTLPQVDSITAGGYGHVSIEEKDGDLYWHLYCHADDFLYIGFTERQFYKAINLSKSSNVYVDNHEGMMVIQVSNGAIGDDKKIKLKFTDSSENHLFYLYIDFNEPYEIKAINESSSNRITLCDEFGSTDFKLFIEENAQQNNKYVSYKHSSFIYGHNKNGVLTHYDNFEDIPFNNEDSVIIKRINEPMVLDGCTYIQTQDTLIYDNYIDIFKGTNEVQNLIQKSPNYPSEICPGQKSVVRVKDGETIGNLGWHEKTRNEFYKDWSSCACDSMIITKPGSYVLSEIYFNGAAGECPVVSNVVEITSREDCKGYLSYYVKNGSSTPLSGVKVKADNGQVEISDKNGKVEFQFAYDNLISKIEIADTNYYYSSQSFELDSEFPYYETERSYLYSFLILQSDLGVTLNSGRNRPGFTIPYYITVSNKSKNEQTTDVTLQLDAALSYNSDEGEIAPDQVNGNTLTWENVTVASGSSERITFYATLDRTTPLGSSLESTVELNLSDDDANNNIDTLISEVTGSYDPNDKLVSFNGFASEGYVHDTTQFEYTVRFQNTGSDTAFTVRIEDVVDKNFDLASIQVVDASHNYRMTIDNDTVNWIFEDILLVDSTTNEPASHGFVRFTIAQNANNPEGTLLTNQASIFFDFNDPIITNEVVNEVGTPPVLATYNWETKEELSVYPNPTSSMLYFPINGKVTIYDAMGNVVLSKNVDQELDVRQLESGIYYYEVLGSEQQLRGRFVKQ